MQYAKDVIKEKIRDKMETMGQLYGSITEYESHIALWVAKITLLREEIASLDAALNKLN